MKTAGGSFAGGSSTDHIAPGDYYELRDHKFPDKSYRSELGNPGV